MDTQELRTLKLLEEIERDQATSQRDLATRLNISLGLVNAFMKRLTKKGYFKITNIPRNRVKYILTPKGAAEKSRLTYEYIQYSFHFYKEIRHKLRDVFEQFEKQNIKKIAFWGIGELAEIAYLYLQESKLSLVAIADDNAPGEMFFGRRVSALAGLRSHEYDRILVTCMGGTESALKTLLAAGIARKRITFLS